MVATGDAAGVARRIARDVSVFNVLGRDGHNPRRACGRGGILGYTVDGGERNVFWRAQTAAMLALALFMIAHPPADWRNGVPQTWLTIPLGVVYLVVALWGLWPGRGQLVARPSRP